VLAQKKARDKSLPDPDFGLREGRDGVLVGLKGPGLAKGEDGVVVEMEVRRKSGRGVKEVFVLSTESSLDDKNNKTKEGVNRAGSSSSGRITLLDDHPLFARPVEVGLGVTEQEGTKEGEGEVETTFSMGLTEKQRKDREGIILPYFDAQNGGGAGEGGRILYEMGREDDFDEDEDDEFA
jgi:elongator complex protein 5